MAVKTKAQLESRITWLEINLAKTQDALQKAEHTIKTIEAQESLPDLPKYNPNTPWLCRDHDTYEARSTAAENVLKQVMEWAGRNYGASGEEDIEKQAAGIGILLAHAFHFYGTPMLLVAAAGLEDANWHTEAAICYRMYDVLTDAEATHKGHPRYKDILFPDEELKPAVVPAPAVPVYNVEDERED